MLRPDDVAQTKTDELQLDHLPRTLEPPRTVSYRSAARGHRQSTHHHLLQEQKTDELPLAFDVPTTAERRVVERVPSRLREKTMHLRSVLARQQAEIEQLLTEREHLKTEFEKEIEIIQHGNQQAVEMLQRQLQEITAERDQLSEERTFLALRYQELQGQIEYEARRQVEIATQTLFSSPESMPALFQDVARTIELRLRQEEEKHLIKTLYLKCEVERVADLLEHERAQVQEEQQHLVALQYSIREQANLRQKALNDRLHIRWRAISVLTTLTALVVLVALQLLFLSLLRIPIVPAVTFAIIAPIVLCVVLAFLLAIPINNIRQIYLGAPHRKKVKEAS